MRKVKRYSKIIISCISLICVLAVSALSTYARADEPYYDDTFQLLNHKNVRSTAVVGTSSWYQSGWFQTKEYIFNKTEPFMMVRYTANAFTYKGESLADSAVFYSQIGVMENGLSGLTVEAGGILDIKFDWYYNIRVDETIYNSSKKTSYYTEDLPVTGLTNQTKMHFSSSANVASDGSKPWFQIDAVEVKNHGIYNSVESDNSKALYWSTVHFRFYNDTDQTLEFEQFVPYYDVVSGWKEPQYSDIIQTKSGGVYPTVKDVSDLTVSVSRSYLYMGYKANVLPSYKIVSAKGAGNFETEQSIQAATDSIVDELDALGSDITGAIDDLDTSINKGLDELGIGIAGGFNDLETSLDKDIKDATSEVKKQLGDLGDQIGSDIDDAVGSADIDTDPFADTNSAIEDQHAKEDETVADLQDKADQALKESGLLDEGSFSSGISSLYKTLEIVGVSFDKILKSFGTEFNVAVTYAIVGGVVITLLGVSAQSFVYGAHVEAGVRERQAAAARDKRVYSQWVRHKINSYVDD